MTRYFTAIVAALLCIILIFVATFAWNNVDAGELIVHQDFTSGELTVWNTAGIHYAGAGDTQDYPKSAEFKFLEQKDEKGQIVSTKNCFPTRFNDKGKAAICGQLSFDLPTTDQLKTIHEKYRSVDAIRDRIVKPSISKGIYYSGPLMSSKESAGSRRGDLLTFIQDQATEGVYVTEEKDMEIEDGIQEVVEMVDVPQLEEDGTVVMGDDGEPVMVKKGMTKSVPQKRMVKVLTPVEKEGQLQVREVSVAKKLGVLLHSFNITAIVYEKQVQDQINSQRDMEMSIQTKIAEAEEARQSAITEEQSGRARAAKARWTQEVAKATAVTLAEQNEEVAKTDLRTAELKAQATVTEAQAEAKAKKLIMEADGALQPRLDAWVKVAMAQAEQIGKQRQVPNVMVGGTPGDNGSAMASLMQLWAARAAQDIGLNPNPTGKPTTAR